MKVLFAIGSLNAGGAERIFMDLIKNMDPKKFDITLVLMDNIGIYRSQLPEHVKVKYVFDHKESGILRKIYGAISVVGSKIMRKVTAVPFYKKVIDEEYDVEIAFIEGDATKFIAQSPNKKSVKYAWVHTDLIKNNWCEKCYRNEQEEKEVYSRFERVIAVSTSVKEAFESKYKMKAKVLYNSLDEKEIYRKVELENVDPAQEDIVRFIAIGRLVEVKGYKRLINSFQKLEKEIPNVELWIVGEGKQYNELDHLIKEFKLENKIRLVGFKQNPYPYLKSADVFVCSSYAEGFSTVVTEALILGIPVVTTECAGMRELLGDSEHGLIVDNSDEGLLYGMKTMAEDKECRNAYKEKAEKRGKDFLVSNRLKEIDRMFDEDLRNK